jgi:hypothetical protein
LCHFVFMNDESPRVLPRVADLSSPPTQTTVGRSLCGTLPLIRLAHAASRLSISHAGYEMSEMDDLPENLSSLGDEELLEARDARDEKLRPLFRRWPSLSRPEMVELRRIYNERVRLAKWIGRTRRKRKVAR